MAHYPVFLELAGRPCLVIGGGAVAARKVDELLGAGAAVTVVSPVLAPALQGLAAAGRIRHLPRGYRAGDLAGHQLAFVAAGDPEVTRTAAAEGHARGVWVNAADDPARCDFILPGVVRRGDLVVAVGTGGASPALTRAVREELEAYFTEDYAVLAEVVASVRRELQARACRPDGAAWRAALDDRLRQLVAEGRPEAARAYLLGRLGGEP